MKRNIIQTLKGFGWRQWVILAAFILVLSFTAFQAVRTVRRAIYWQQQQQHRDELIKEWMTVGYVAHSYHVPPPALFEALGLELEPRDRRSLKEIAETQNRTFSEVKNVLEETIKAERLKQAPPAGGNP